MLIIIDTDIVNKLTDSRQDCRKFCELLDEHHVHVTAPDTVAEEVLHTSDSQRRADLSRTLIELLRDCRLLAPLRHQVEWGVQRFLSGEAVFKPFDALKSDSVKACLSNALNSKKHFTDLINSKMSGEARDWDTMHAEGRPSLQAVLQSGVPEPKLGEWMVAMQDGEFGHEWVLERVNPAEQQRLRPRVAEYVEWNPVCKCFLELYLLAIHRHGIMDSKASSIKGPKWADYYISAFVGIADYFVTDDRRLRDALDRHRELRRELRMPVPWEIRSLDGFLTDLQDGRVRNQGDSGLETWSAVEHEAKPGDKVAGTV